MNAQSSEIYDRSLKEKKNNKYCRIQIDIIVKGWGEVPVTSYRILQY